MTDDPWERERDRCCGCVGRYCCDHGEADCDD